MSSAREWQEGLRDPARASHAYVEAREALGQGWSSTALARACGRHCLAQTHLARSEAHWRHEEQSWGLKRHRDGANEGEAEPRLRMGLKKARTPTDRSGRFTECSVL